MTELPDGRDVRAAARILRELRRRARQRSALLWAARGAMLGALLTGALAVALFIVQPPELRLRLAQSLLLTPALAALGWVVGRLRRVDDLTVARALDRAALSDDGFASAIQLAGDRHPQRVRLVLADALQRVRDVRPAAALPIVMPAFLRWLPLPLVAVGVLILIAPNPRLVANEPPPPEISEEEWQEVTRSFQEELAELPEPVTAEERELADEMRRLAELLEQRPEKKEVLALVAKLRAELQKRQEAAGAGDVSLRQAARAMQPAAALREIAAALQQGDYSGAAEAAKALAERLKQDQQKLTATDFEAVAADFDALAQQMKTPADLSEACRNAANAAGSMNRQALSEAVRRFGENLKKNSTKLRNCDSRCRTRSALDRLAQKLSQCRGGKCGQCNKCGNKLCQGNCGRGLGRFGQGKGGLRPGFGTADRWTGGALAPTPEQRFGDEVDVEETDGEQTTHTTVSPDERAAAAQREKELYIELIRKAEADLALESVPPAHRDYLRRYFLAIRPSDAPAEEADGTN
jgi:hypothetical protein